jgi:phenylacetate-CoA ligase
MWQMLKDWAWLERSQWFGEDKITGVQARKLEATVNHAYETVPFYRELYNQKGIDHLNFDSPAGVTGLPIVSKDDFRKSSLEERTASDTDSSSCTIRITSGSSGAPIKILMAPRETTYLMALRLRLFRAYGIGPLDRICMSIPGAWGTSNFLQTKGLLGALIKHEFRELPLAENFHEHFALFAKWKPTVLYAPVSYFRALTQFMDETGKSLRLKLVLTGSEMLDRATRKQIEDKTDAEVFETYGLVDAGAIAWECPTRSGYHINADSLVVEFLRDGQPVHAGEPGEVCVTNLYKNTTPVIRYLVGDMATPLDSDCECGRGLPMLKNIEGRTVDFIVTKNGQYVSPYTVMYRLESLPGIEEFRVTQRGDYSVEVLLRVERAFADEAIKAAQDQCVQLFGETPFSIKAVEKMESTRGEKRRPVKSLVSR